ncbi:MAG: hypothetical protein L3J83_11985 [Proteobacteria bacterium]|nr:hypothetical protein [Pseudomonadota bacterium]
MKQIFRVFYRNLLIFVMVLLGCSTVFAGQNISMTATSAITVASNSNPCAMKNPCGHMKNLCGHMKNPCGHMKNPCDHMKNPCDHMKNSCASKHNPCGKSKHSSDKKGHSNPCNPCAMSN